MLDYFASATFEKPYDLFYILIIFLLGYAAYAAASAFLYMKLQTRTEFAT
jgi:hypothetical protein